MGIITLTKLSLYYLFHTDISIASIIGEKRFCTTIQGSAYCLPYDSNFNISLPNKNTKQAIIVIHGILKNSHDICKSVTKRVFDYNKGPSVTILCPQFLTKADIEKNKLPTNTLFWSFEGWDAGYNSKNAGLRISSFSLLDSMLTTIANRKKFPNLKEVKIIGFSAGAQFVQRYAVLTSIEKKLSVQGIKLTYLPISPSSYLYLNKARPHSLDASCKVYDDYKYGLKNININYTVDNLAEIKQNYKFKRIIYIVGKKDNSKFNIFLDRSCQAQAQGANRKERLQNYFSYLLALYGQDIKNYQEIRLIPKVAHDSSQIFASDLWLYD